MVFQEKIVAVYRPAQSVRAKRVHSLTGLDKNEQLQSVKPHGKPLYIAPSMAEKAYKGSTSPSRLT